MTVESLELVTPSQYWPSQPDSQIQALLVQVPWPEHNWPSSVMQLASALTGRPAQVKALSWRMKARLISSAPVGSTNPCLSALRRATGSV
jgi:hypothetical protein